MLIKNGTINTMAASGIIKADIRVQDGRIAAVGENLKEEAGELIIDASGKQIFPGMVEAHCHLGMEESAIRGEGDDVNEMSDPITPQVRAIDGCNPLDETIVNARNAGITTVAAGPGSANVIGGTFMAYKTYGVSIDEMVIQKSGGDEMCLWRKSKACLSGQPDQNQNEHRGAAAGNAGKNKGIHRKKGSRKQ